MASSASCCLSSTPVSSKSHGSSHFRRPLHLLLTSTTISSPRVMFPSASSSLRLRSPVSASSPDPPLDVAQDEHWSEDRDDRYGFEIQVSKTGKRNRRLVQARVLVDAPLDAVWATLTDYEGLADFIPGLSECRLLDQDHRFARLYQVGEQDLALGFKFNAKGTIDCYEGEMELLPTAGTRRREIAFTMIDGDFKLFEGKWSVQEVADKVQVHGSIVEGGEISEDQQFQTILSYLVELEPKLWVPVRLLEGRICSEIKNNLISIREQAQRIQRLQHEQEVHKDDILPTLSSKFMGLSASGLGTIFGRLLIGTAGTIPASELVDTTGCGDAFIGAVLNGEEWTIR